MRQPRTPSKLIHVSEAHQASKHAAFGLPGSFADAAPAVRLACAAAARADIDPIPAVRSTRQRSNNHDLPALLQPVVDAKRRAANDID
jgi:hypothetical protein